MSPLVTIIVAGKVRRPFLHGENERREVLWMEHLPVHRHGSLRVRDTRIYRRELCLGLIRTRWYDGIESQATQKHTEVRPGCDIAWLARAS